MIGNYEILPKLIKLPDWSLMPNLGGVVMVKQPEVVDLKENEFGIYVTVVQQENVKSRVRFNGPKVTLFLVLIIIGEILYISALHH